MNLRRNVLWWLVNPLTAFSIVVILRLGYLGYISREVSLGAFIAIFVVWVALQEYKKKSIRQRA